MGAIFRPRQDVVHDREKPPLRVVLANKLKGPINESNFRHLIETRDADAITSIIETATPEDKRKIEALLYRILIRVENTAKGLEDSIFINEMRSRVMTAKTTVKTPPELK